MLAESKSATCSVQGSNRHTKESVIGQTVNITFRIAAVLASALPMAGLLAYGHSLAEVTPPAALAVTQASPVRVLSPIVVTAKRTGGAEARLQDEAPAAGA